MKRILISLLLLINSLKSAEQFKNLLSAISSIEKRDVFKDTNDLDNILFKNAANVFNIKL